MSHEGIRPISPEDAEKEEFEQRELPHAAKDPAKVRVHKTDGTGLEIDWKDGHHSAWSFTWLRDACPCATCHEEREATGRKPGEPKPKPQTLLAMYEEPPRPIEVTPAGKYAIKFKWNDGHEAGIYSWEYLRRVCNCKDCRAARG
ncbi:MAG: gamma-butyrobetaine hydroxylase-like domain-containing protein [Rhodanobacteraceae bacterium]